MSARKKVIHASFQQFGDYIFTYAGRTSEHCQVDVEAFLLHVGLSRAEVLEVRKSGFKATFAPDSQGKVHVSDGDWDLPASITIEHHVSGRKRTRYPSGELTAYLLDSVQTRSFTVVIEWAPA